MNYGFEDKLPLNLTSDQDKSNRLQIQLYEHVINGIDLNEKSLLEVGSGRGGGLDYLCRYKRLNALTGIDLSHKAIKQCKSAFACDKLQFIQGSSDNLPVANKSQDIVLNVESSHCYPDMNAFVKEAHRVLKPDGDFLLCDLRNKSGEQAIEKTFKECGFKIIKKNVITKNVLDALDIMSNDRRTIADDVPVILRKAFIDFAGVNSSTAYDLLKDNKLIYVSYQLKK